MRRSQNDGKSYRDTCNKIPSGLAHLRPSGETLSHKCLDRSLFFRGFGRPESDLAREGLLLGIAPSRRWRDPKDCRRYPKVPQGYAEGSAKMTKHQPEGSSKMTKHRRVRRGPAPEGGALNRRNASGSAEAKMMKVKSLEACRRSSLRVVEHHRTRRATLSKVMTRTFGCGGRLKNGER